MGDHRRVGGWNSISRRCIDATGALVPTTHVRKMRWTWAADLQSGDFERSEFAVAVTNWRVSGHEIAVLRRRNRKPPDRGRRRSRL